MALIFPQLPFNSCTLLHNFQKKSVINLQTKLLILYSFLLVATNTVYHLPSALNTNTFKLGAWLSSQASQFLLSSFSLRLTQPRPWIFYEAKDDSCSSGFYLLRTGVEYCTRPLFCFVLLFWDKTQRSLGRPGWLWVFLFSDYRNIPSAYLALISLLPTSHSWTMIQSSDPPLHLFLILKRPLLVS